MHSVRSGCLSTSGILTVFQLSTISMKDLGNDPPHQSELNPSFDLTTQGQ